LGTTRSFNYYSLEKQITMKQTLLAIIISGMVGCKDKPEPIESFRGEGYTEDNISGGIMIPDHKCMYDSCPHITNGKDGVLRIKGLVHVGDSLVGSYPIDSLGNIIEDTGWFHNDNDNRIYIPSWDSFSKLPRSKRTYIYSKDSAGNIVEDTVCVHNLVGPTLSSLPPKQQCSKCKKLVRLYDLPKNIKLGGVIEKNTLLKDFNPKKGLTKTPITIIKDSLP